MHMQSLCYIYTCYFYLDPLDSVPEILDQSDRVGAKSSIFTLYSLVAPQP